MGAVIFGSDSVSNTVTSLTVCKLVRVILTPAFSIFLRPLDTTRALYRLRLYRVELRSIDVSKSSFTADTVAHEATESALCSATHKASRRPIRRLPRNPSRSYSLLRVALTEQQYSCVLIPIATNERRRKTCHSGRFWHASRGA